MGGVVMDKFYRGFTAGVLAAIPLNAWSFFSFYVLQLTDMRMLDWAGVAIYGSLPQTLVQVVTALALQLLWSGFRGIIFSYLIPHVTSQGYMGKAVIFSLIVSFLESAVSVLYKVPNLAETTTGTAFSALLGSLLWGVLLGYFCRLLDETKTPKKAG
jgi:hypothetical protein